MSRFKGIRFQTNCMQFTSMVWLIVWWSSPLSTTFVDCKVMAQQFVQKKILFYNTEEMFKMPRCTKTETYCTSKYSK